MEVINFQLFTNFNKKNSSKQKAHAQKNTGFG